MVWDQRPRLAQWLGNWVGMNALSHSPQPPTKTKTGTQRGFGAASYGLGLGAWGLTRSAPWRLCSPPSPGCHFPSISMFAVMEPKMVASMTSALASAWLPRIAFDISLRSPPATPSCLRPPFLPEEEGKRCWSLAGTAAGMVGLVDRRGHTGPKERQAPAPQPPLHPGPTAGRHLPAVNSGGVFIRMVAQLLSPNVSTKRHRGKYVPSCPMPSFLPGSIWNLQFGLTCIVPAGLSMLAQIKETHATCEVPFPEICLEGPYF